LPLRRVASDVGGSSARLRTSGERLGISFLRAGRVGVGMGGRGGSPASPSSVCERDVFLFVPNVIGYARVVLGVAAFVAAGRGWADAFVGLYVGSFALDAVDGWAARLLGQASRFGGVLDMVTDRTATAALMLLLAHVAPSHWGAFACLLALDVGSHWVHMTASLLDSAGKHHKDAASSRSGLVKLYYTSKVVFAYCCIGAELLWVALYILNARPRGVLASWGALGFPLPDVFVRGLEAAGLRTALGVAAGQGLSAVQGLAVACLPGAALKQVTNVAQLIEASRVVVRIDVDQRRRAKA